MTEKKFFTLVELLVTVGIIALLAGLLLPAVIGGAERGKITQAKSDMKAIQMALTQAEITYGSIPKKNGDNKYKFQDVENTILKGSEISYLRFSNSNVTCYNALIAELTVPTNSKFTSTKPVNFNKRKIKLLDPKPKFDPTQSYDTDQNSHHLWRDPWGMPYTILINVDQSDRIPHPDESERVLSGKFMLYSWGPNASDDHGRNANSGGAKTDDDITSWE